MREFKFRVWDIEDNEMFYNKDICFISPYDNLVRIENDEYNFMGSYAKYGSNLILMQYTGFKDIKGQEIYEGDILAHQDYWWIRIEYDSGSFMVRDVDKVRYNNKICNIPIGDFDISKWRVIGNIFENKELFLNI